MPGRPEDSRSFGRFGGSRSREVKKRRAVVSQQLQIEARSNTHSFVSRRQVRFASPPKRASPNRLGAVHTQKAPRRTPGCKHQNHATTPTKAPGHRAEAPVDRHQDPLRPHHRHPARRNLLHPHARLHPHHLGRRPRTRRLRRLQPYGSRQPPPFPPPIQQTLKTPGPGLLPFQPQRTPGPQTAGCRPPRRRPPRCGPPRRGPKGAG